MKNCDTILANHVIAVTKKDLINLVVANEAVDMKVDNEGLLCRNRDPETVRREIVIQTTEVHYVKVLSSGKIKQKLVKRANTVILM